MRIYHSRWVSYTRYVSHNQNRKNFPDSFDFNPDDVCSAKLYHDFNENFDEDFLDEHLTFYKWCI